MHDIQNYIPGKIDVSFIYNVGLKLCLKQYKTYLMLLLMTNMLHVHYS